MQNLDDRDLKQTYHKPEFCRYGSISVLTASRGSGTKCDATNGGTNCPGPNRTL